MKKAGAWEEELTRCLFIYFFKVLQKKNTKTIDVIHWRVLYRPMGWQGVKDQDRTTIGVVNLSSMVYDGISRIDIIIIIFGAVQEGNSIHFVA